MVHLPKTKNKTGALHFDVNYRPQYPRPFNVPNGEEVLISISIGYDGNRVTNGEIVVQVLALTEPPAIPNHISGIDTLNDGILPHAG